MHFLLELGFFAVLVLLLLMWEQRHLKLNGLVDIDQLEPRSPRLWRFQGLFINIGCPRVVVPALSLQSRQETRRYDSKHFNERHQMSEKGLKLFCH